MLRRTKGLKRTGTLKKGSSLKRTSILKTTCSLKPGTSILKQTTRLNKQNPKAKEMWTEVREQVLARDNHKCIVCGKPATQVHHIHLRSKRHDLLYELNNLCSLCDQHHFHHTMDKYKEQTALIALVKHMTVDELLAFAETPSK